jgi:hypothetical protein
MASLLPEIFPENHFDEDALLLWNQGINAHNSTLDRGQFVQNPAEPQFARPCFCGRDGHMHADKIVLVLKPLVKFGERVVPLIREDPTARAWYLNEHLLIHAHHWNALARQVMNFVRQLGLLAAENNAQQSSISFNEFKLLDAGRRAVEIYGVYAMDDRTVANSKQKHSASGGCGSSIENRDEMICSGTSGFSSEPRRLERNDSHKRSKPNPVPA